MLIYCLKSETDLTTGTGKFSIDYKIVQDITATNLSPSTNKKWRFNW